MEKVEKRRKAFYKSREPPTGDPTRKRGRLEHERRDLGRGSFSTHPPRRRDETRGTNAISTGRKGFVIPTSKSFELTSALETLYFSPVRSALECASRSACGSVYDNRLLARRASPEAFLTVSRGYVLKTERAEHDHLPVSNKLGLISSVRY